MPHFRLLSRLLFIAFWLAMPLAAQERLTNLPHVFIDTFDGNDIWSKSTYTYATLTRVDTADVIERFDSMRIRGRGNSTWGMAKKPYKIKFNEKEKFLGKGFAKTKNWTLIANHADKTLMRNALTSILGEWIGLKNQPAHEFVDLTLNSSYRGTYMISDHVDVRPHRVNVEEQDFPLTDESDISGGYLFEFDGFHDGIGFYTPHVGTYVRIHYPDEDEIAWEQRQFAEDFFADIEERLFSDDFRDTLTGWQAVMDTTSLVQWYLATEISANIDGFWSTYCYKFRQDPHLFFGPLWDYDIAYGNDYRKGDTTRKLMRTDAYDGSRKWVTRLWEDPAFQDAVGRRYAALLEAGLDSVMLAAVDSMAALLQQSQALNFELWGIDQRAYNERVLYSTYDEYLADLRTFIPAHNAYLAEQFCPSTVNPEPTPDPDPTPDPTPDPEPDPVPELVVPDSVFVRFLNVGTRTAIDADDTNIVAWEVDTARSTQLWHATPTVDGFYRLYNADTGLCLCDPDEGIGAQLTLGADDEEGSLWQIVPQAEGVNLISVASENCANLSGGGSQNGTPVLSYTSDARNATSNNRRWYLTATDIPTAEDEEVTALGASQEADAAGAGDYALAYNPQTDCLHFGGDHALTFTARVYTIGGQFVGTFTGGETFPMHGLPHGTYIVTWTHQSRPHSIKFRR